MDERARRVGLNEAVFREVNERIDDLAQTFGLAGNVLELVCECGSATCTEQIHLTAGEYETLRKDPTLFAMYPGHEIADVEEIVERRGGYDVVRKRTGEPAALAEETDPRH